MNKTLIIAEAGVNHNGSVALAFKLVDAAKEAGVDIVKFQTFQTEQLVTPEAEQAEYQIKNTEKKQSQYAMLKALELSFEEHLAVKEYCQKQGIEYLSTAFDFTSLDFLVNTMKLTRLKIPSGEITNAPFILAHALTGCDLILSTGMATLAEIEFALSIIAFGYLKNVNPNDSNLLPGEQAFALAFSSKQGQAVLQNKVTILHCTTEYPAPLAEVNLNAIGLMRTTFNLAIGYSDHTQGTLVSIAAVAKGAQVIEKHFTLDQKMDGPDHKASIEPEQLTEMVQGIRAVELALGQAVKAPSPCEVKNMAVVRKSLMAKQDIKKGQAFTEDNLAIMRPGTGLSPMHYYQILGTLACDNFSAGELITR
jgi:N-acetylneuraminate synthase